MATCYKGFNAKGMPDTIMHTGSCYTLPVYLQAETAAPIQEHVCFQSGMQRESVLAPAWPHPTAEDFTPAETLPGRS